MTTRRGRFERPGLLDNDGCPYRSVHVSHRADLVRWTGSIRHRMVDYRRRRNRDVQTAIARKLRDRPHLVSPGSFQHEIPPPMCPRKSRAPVGERKTWRARTRNTPAGCLASCFACPRARPSQRRHCRRLPVRQEGSPSTPPGPPRGKVRPGDCRAGQIPHQHLIHTSGWPPHGGGDHPPVGHHHQSHPAPLRPSSTGQPLGSLGPAPAIALHVPAAPDPVLDEIHECETENLNDSW